MSSEIIQKNYELYLKAINKMTSYPHKEKILDFVEDNKERIMCCPASTKTEFTRCYPGGLLEHSLMVYANMFGIKKNIKDLMSNIKLDSIITVGLLHDIGKIGNSSHDYYMDAEPWMVKKGQFYQVNPKLGYMSPAQWSLYHLQANEILLEEEELFAILSIKQMKMFGEASASDNVPNGHEPILSVVLQQAVKLACLQGKGLEKPQLIGSLFE